jgi:hypothetical protein
MSLIVARAKVIKNANLPDDFNFKDQKNFMSYRKGTIIVHQGRGNI